MLKTVSSLDETGVPYNPRVKESVCIVLTSDDTVSLKLMMDNFDLSRKLSDGGELPDVGYDSLCRFRDRLSCALVRAGY